ncbi:MAG: hypothetical protein ACLFWM_04815 [Actinomycetota bacterium]
MTARETRTQGESTGGRLLRGALAGLVAGAVFIAINMWFVSSMGDPATAPFRLISTLVLGAEALEEGTASVPLGLVVHGAISILFGLVFALVVPRFGTNGTVALAGALYGAAVYVLDFLILANTAFPQFQAPNDPLELSAHVVFGLLVALFFYSTGPRSGERVFEFA